ncbi:MAG: hypothetical protein R3E10_04290 [Gemmatimonadota bacterium]
MDHANPNAANAEASQAEREALASVMERVEQRAETSRQVAQTQRPPKPLLARPSTMIGLSLTLVGVLVWNTITFREQPLTLTRDQAAEAARAGAALAVLGIEAYRTTNGRLPTSLDELGFGIPGVTYRPAGARYTLTSEVEGQATHLAEYENPSILFTPGVVR